MQPINLTINEMKQKNKIILLNVVGVFLIIIWGFLSIWNPLEKNNNNLSLLGLGFCSVLLFVFLFFRKNEMKKKLSLLSVLLIAITLYFII